MDYICVRVQARISDAIECAQTRNGWSGKGGSKDAKGSSRRTLPSHGCHLEAEEVSGEVALLYESRDFCICISISGAEGEEEQEQRHWLAEGIIDYIIYYIIRVT